MKKTALVAVDYDYNEWEMKYKHPSVIILNCVRLGGIMQTTVEFDAGLPTAPIRYGYKLKAPLRLLMFINLFNKSGAN